MPHVVRMPERSPELKELEVAVHEASIMPHVVRAIIVTRLAAALTDETELMFFIGRIAKNDPRSIPRRTLNCLPLTHPVSPARRSQAAMACFFWSPSWYPKFPEQAPQNSFVHSMYASQVS